MKPYRVLVRRKDGNGFAFEDVTHAQYVAYCNNDPAWRNAKDDAPTTWAERAWRHLLGKRPPP